MQDLLKYFENAKWFIETFGPWLPYLAVAALIALLLCALAAMVYVTKTATSPFMKVLQWLFAYTPGEVPSPVVQGLSHGARILAWGSMVALVAYVAIRSFS
jgi:hypothetical protein